MTKITIAIDGYSSTGKSTVAKLLAKKLDYIYVDTGAMYRAVALFALRHDVIIDDKVNREKLIEYLDQINIAFKSNPLLGYAEVYLNNENVEQEIRQIRVSNAVSKVAEISEVRKKLVEQQQVMGQYKGVVMDGRDIGTVVFPDAEVKIFMEASAEKRAQRRYDEMLQKGETISYQDVLDNVTSRDLIDTTREDSPVVKASDAIVLDNSDLTVEKTFEKIEEIVNDKLRNV